MTRLRHRAKRRARQVREQSAHAVTKWRRQWRKYARYDRRSQAYIAFIDLTPFVPPLVLRADDYEFSNDPETVRRWKREYAERPDVNVFEAEYGVLRAPGKTEYNLRLRGL